MNNKSKSSISTKSRFLISPADLYARLGEKNLSIVDASFYLPAMKRDAKAEFLKAHIPGAVWFDIDEIATEHPDGLPHMMANVAVFSSKLGKLGVSNNDSIVVYDGMGLFSAPRVWLNFRQMGVKNVFILDGGFPAWIKAGFETKSGSPHVKASIFKAHPQDIVVTLDEMREYINDPDMTIVDARPEARFTGRESEPRPNLRCGHMPGAKSVPLTAITDNGHLKSLEELHKIFQLQGIFESDRVIATCGSGVTAAAIIFALESLDHLGTIKLYDGSWSEWGSYDDTPIALGDAHHGRTVCVTYLEMQQRPGTLPSRPSGQNISLLAVRDMPPPFYLFLQREVGDKYDWVNRRRMPIDKLQTILQDEATEIYVLYLDGSPAGFYEIDRSDVKFPEIAFFGLMERAIGRGLGRWFLGCAIDTAWNKFEPKEIKVHTCTADHPAALGLYQKLGFSPVATADEKIYPLKPYERPI